MMRRLIYMFATGLVATATALTTVGAASASTAAPQRAGCVADSSTHLHVTKTGINYYLGTPNNTFAGAVVRLKPAANGTTDWTFCEDVSNPGQWALYNRGLVLTATRQASADVTVQFAGNFGAGFALQRWFITDTSTGGFIFTNVRTGQFLRVRNSGPTMGQTVTTGFTPRTWFPG
jgi:Ricin-type beta-trefoil lectin domain-like